MSNLFKLAFLSSSDFTIPILENILESEAKSLQEILTEQLLFLQKNQARIKQSGFLEIKNSLTKIKSKILNKKLKLELVISQPDRKNRKKTIANPISKLAREKNLNLLTPNKINQEHQNFQPSLNSLDMALTASFGQIISSQVLKLPKFGFINWHPSLLPKYRGATPMQSAIACGESITGLSWIEMTPKMDAGEVLLQLTEKIEHETDFNQLAKKMASLGQNTWLIAILSEVLRQSDPENKTSQKQANKEATFTKMLDKKDAVIDPSLLTANQVFNHYKAYQNFPKTVFLETEKFKQKLILNQVSLSQGFKPLDSEIIYSGKELIQVKQDKTLKTFLKCKDQTHLELKKITTEQGKQIDLQGVVL